MTETCDLNGCPLLCPAQLKAVTKIVILEQQNNIVIMTINFNTNKNNVSSPVGTAIIHHHHCIQNSSDAQPAFHP